MTTLLRLNYTGNIYEICFNVLQNTYIFNEMLANTHYFEMAFHISVFMLSSLYRVKSACAC